MSRRILLGALSVSAVVVALILFFNRQQSAFFNVQIETPADAGSELFRVELIVASASEGTQQSEVLSSQLVRAKQPAQVDLPQACCDTASRVLVRVDHPSYRSEDVLIGLYGEINETDAYTITPRALEPWLALNESVNFMQAQAHFDRTRSYLETLASHQVDIPSALAPQRTDAVLRALFRSARFQSNTEKTWSIAAKQEKMLALREDFQQLQIKLFLTSTENDTALQATPPPPYRSE